MAYYRAKTVVVTGANRGIGLALVKHLLKQGAVVYAGARHPEQAQDLRALDAEYGDALLVVSLDVQQQDSIAAFAKTLGASALDILINNAGVNLDKGRGVKDLPAEVLAQTFDANTLGPYRMVQTCLPALHRAPQPVVANISSVMGSIAENESGGHIAYRVSKTATNMLTKCIALEDDKLIALTLHPGWVKTRMGGDSAQIDVDTAAAGLLDVIIGATPKDSGNYFRYSGERVPW